MFLVDTYDTLQGVRNAVEIGRELRRQGHEMIGIRLDSGDLAWLSIEARRMLDEAGFPNAVILASQRSGRKHHRQPERPGGEDQRLGRGNQAGDRPRRSGLGRRV